MWSGSSVELSIFVLIGSIIIKQVIQASSQLIVSNNLSFLIVDEVGIDLGGLTVRTLDVRRAQTPPLSGMKSTRVLHIHLVARRRKE